MLATIVRKELQQPSLLWTLTSLQIHTFFNYSLTGNAKYLRSIQNVHTSILWSIKTFVFNKLLFYNTLFWAKQNMPRDTSTAQITTKFILSLLIPTVTDITRHAYIIVTLDWTVHRGVKNLQEYMTILNQLITLFKLKCSQPWTPYLIYNIQCN